MLSVAAVEGGRVRKGQHGGEAWWTIESKVTPNSQLLLLSQHDSADAGIACAIDPEILVVS